MLFSLFSNSVFESMSLAYVVALPFIAVLVLSLLALPAAHKATVDPAQLLRAIFSYLGQMLGVVLMSLSAIPAMHAVFALQPLSSLTYVGLLIVFGIGGALFLWHDAELAKIGSVHKEVPHALFLYTWKVVGLLIVTLSGLSLLLNVLLPVDLYGDWWVLHMIMILYGLLISWLTLHRPSGSKKFTSINTSPTPTVSRPRKTRKATKTTKRARK